MRKKGKWSYEIEHVCGLYEVQVLKLMHSGDRLDVFFLVVYQMCNKLPQVLIFFFKLSVKFV